MEVLAEFHGWWFIPLFWFGWILLFWVIGPRFWWRRHHHGWHGHGGSGSPEAVLGERYARGEIDEQEYRSRLAVLRDQGK